MINIGSNPISNMFLGSTEIVQAYLGTTSVYSSVPAVIKFTARDNSFIRLSRIATSQVLEYSLDMIAWNSMTSAVSLSLSTGDEVYMRGILSGNNTSSIYTQFKIGGDVSVEGNINALWNYHNPNAALKPYCGYNLFKDCSGLKDVTELQLPATSLVPSCYDGLLRGTEISQAPELPATTLASSCYQSMFKGCGYLATAPVLSATTLANSCYRSMFSGCSVLSQAPELPATTLAPSCYYEMFGGNLTNVQPIITVAPTLPATTLVSSCYENMFRNCTRLSLITCLATNIEPLFRCTTSWVLNVSSAGTFMKNARMSSWTTGDSGIPSGWAVSDVEDPMAGYTRVEYVGGNNKSYLETGYTPTISTVIQFGYNQVVQSGDMTIGTGMNDDNDDWRYFNNGTIYFDWGSERINYDGGWTDQDLELEIGNYYVSNLSTGSIIASGSPQSTIPQLGTVKFIYPANGSANTAYAKYIRIYENGTLMKEFLPVTRDADGVAGFFETQSSTFYESANEYAFNLVGNPIS